MNDINNTIDRQEIGGIKNITNIRWFALLLEIIPLVLCIGTLVFSSLDYFPLMFMFLFSVGYCLVYLFVGFLAWLADAFERLRKSLPPLSAVLGQGFCPAVNGYDRHSRSRLRRLHGRNRAATRKPGDAAMRHSLGESGC